MSVESRIHWLGEQEDIQLPVALEIDGNGGQSVNLMTDVLAEFDARAATPLRLKGTAKFSEVESFIAHANRFKTPESVVFADTSKVSLLAVYDYHEKDDDHLDVG